MTQKHTQEITANVKRATDSIRAARILMAEGLCDFAASRAYYGAFYAATAALLSEGLTFSKHGGVISAFHREFVREGKVDARVGKDLNWLFELRGIGDYGETRHVTAEETYKAVDAAEHIISTLQDMVGTD